MSSNEGRRNVCRVIDGLMLEAGALVEPGDLVVKHKVTGYVRAAEKGPKDYFCVGEMTGAGTADARGKADGEVTCTVNQGDLLVDWGDNPSPPDGRSLCNMMYIAGRRLITLDPTNNAEAGRLINVEVTKPNRLAINKPVITVQTT